VGLAWLVQWCWTMEAGVEVGMLWLVLGLGQEVGLDFGLDICLCLRGVRPHRRHKMNKNRVANTRFNIRYPVC
jgi:hypothetical protein